MPRISTSLAKISAQLCLFLISAILPALAIAQSPALVIPTESQLDAIVSISPKRPGAVVAVISGGSIAVAKAYGLADLAHQIPFTVRTRSNIGSTSKQFTAYAIALLASEKKLSLDDDIRRFIPELPDFGEMVTLRHLLTHTSGYRELYSTRQLAGHALETPFDRSEILRLIQRQAALQNLPGREWSYNNTGYALLALVVERVTATPFPRWMHEHVFAPLGMNDTVVRATPDDEVPYSARGYLLDATSGAAYREARDLSAALGASAIYTTVEDLARWMKNFSPSSAPNHALFAQLTTPAVPTSMGKTAYGLGLYLDEWRGLRRIYHDGDDVAHHSVFYYFPAHDLGILVETNDASFNATRAATRIAELVLAQHLVSSKNKNVPSAEFEPALFDRYTGSYESDKTPGLIYTFTRENNCLNVSVAGETMEIIPVNDARFRVKGQNVDLEFDAADSNSAHSVTIFNRGEEKARRLTALPSASSSFPRDLTAYAGHYESAELETTYTFAVIGDALSLLHPKFPQPLSLKPIAGERFGGPDPVASILFERDAQNQIVGFRVGKGSGYEYITFAKTR